MPPWAISRASRGVRTEDVRIPFSVVDSADTDRHRPRSVADGRRTAQNGRPGRVHPALEKGGPMTAPALAIIGIDALSLSLRDPGTGGRHGATPDRTHRPAPPSSAASSFPY
jgi:hypothetical protein